MIFRGRRVLTEYITAYKSTLEYIRVYNRVDNGVISEYEGGDHEKLTANLLSMNGEEGHKTECYKD